MNSSVMLHEHLNHNFVPAIPAAFDCAIEAIEAVNDGDYCKEIVTPSGNKMLATDIIEELHLDYFIDDEHLGMEDE